MNKLGSPRSMAIVFVLAALAFTASGVPDNKGTDAAIGWFTFLALALVFLVLAGRAVVRRRRKEVT
jgi:membrane protein DedA with SNARE-associated domain